MHQIQRLGQICPLLNLSRNFQINAQLQLIVYKEIYSLTHLETLQTRYKSRSGLKWTLTGAQVQVSQTGNKCSCRKES